jgi:putative FmdB family regulatory protein
MMPTYEYSCKECGTYGSVHRTYKEDDGGMNCPKCGLDMTRIYSTVGLVFKGDGWAGKSK